MAQFVDLNLPHLESAAIVIDAQANEPAWDEAYVVDHFISYRPVPDEAPTTQAVVRILSDDKALYVHYTVTDPEPEKIRARYTNRDNIWGDETAGIYLDPQGDGQRAYLFMCNPLGVQAEATRVSGEGDEFSWDTKWQSAGQLTDTGYILEIAIPWDSVRHPESIDTVGVSFLYSSARSGQRASWPRRDPNISGILIHQATFQGPGVVSAGDRFHIIPELTFGLNEEGPSSTRTGFGGFAPGVTMRYSPTQDLTLLATANPDFSQVEGDQFQIDVNQRYALYYEEKRPFFLEGQEWLNYGPVVYTRSMVMPHVGLRATSETKHWRTAALSVLDAAPTGSVNEGRGWTDEDVEGNLALNNVLRSRRTFPNDAHFGAIYSDKRILGTDLHNQVMGFDWRNRLTPATILSGGAASSITSLSDGDTISGTTGAVNAGYESRNWEMYGDVSWVSPDFRAENGFLTVSDIVNVEGNIEREFYPKDKALKKWDLELSMNNSWDFNGNPRFQGFEPKVGFRFANSRYLYVSPGYWGEEYEGEWLTSRGVSAYTGARTSRFWSYMVFGYAGEGPYYDEDNPRVINVADIGTQVTLRPSRRVSVSLSASASNQWEEEGVLNRGAVGRLYLTTFFTPQMWLRTIADYSSFSESSNIESLFAWQHSPGSAFYLGASTNLQEETWQTFAKLSWDFGR